MSAGLNELRDALIINAALNDNPVVTWDELARCVSDACEIVEAKETSAQVRRSPDVLRVPRFSFDHGVINSRADGRWMRYNDAVASVSILVSELVIAREALELARCGSTPSAESIGRIEEALNLVCKDRKP